MPASWELENQTQFTVEEPFMEDPLAPPVSNEAPKPKVPFLKRRKTIVGLLVLTLVISLGLLFGYAQYVAWQRRLSEPPVPVVPTAAPLQRSSLYEEAQALKGQLKLADPVKQELLFPQIDPELRLEEKRL